MGLDRQRVVDLLPDRTADTLAAWLRAHPGVELATRDRAPAYAQGIAAGAPNATQVADRFHLLVNVREAVEHVFARHADAVAAALTDPPEPPSPTPATVNPPSPYVQRKQAAAAGRRTRRAARYAEVLRRRETGTPIRDIASTLRVSSATILRYLKTGSVPTGSAGRPGRSRLDPFRPYLAERLAAGCRNARTLHQELRERGFAGGYETVRRAVQLRTGVDGRKRTRGPLAPPATPIPSARKLSFGVMRWPDRRSEAEAACVRRLGAAGASIAAAVHLGEQFGAAVRSRDGTGLDAWLTAAGASDLAEFRGLAGSMREDLAAVRAGVIGPQSNGPVEGAVNRLKTIKRSMYGRAGFALLKARVLHAA